MRRKPGTLLPIEVALLDAALAVADHGDVHGFELAKQLQDGPGSRRLVAHGTLYKALSRLERAGLLASRWEDPELAASERRPARRLYTVTGVGERALARAQRDPDVAVYRPRGAWSPS